MVDKPDGGYLSSCVEKISDERRESVGSPIAFVCIVNKHDHLARVGQPISGGTGNIQESCILAAHSGVIS